MVTLTIDGRTVSVPEGTTILEAAQTLRISIPTLCYLKDINEIGACRICMVEVEGYARLVPSCDSAVSEGMVVYTSSPRVREARRVNLRLLLSQHETKCTKCTRSGNCKLQQLTNDYNLLGDHYIDDLKNIPTDYSNPVVRIENRCVKCMRCIQVCEKIQGMGIWDLMGTGTRTTVGVAHTRTLGESDCTFCGQCITHCPVGGLQEHDDTGKVFDALANKDRITVVQVAPAVRAAWAEFYHLDPKFATAERMVTALKTMGFDYVFDTDFAADLTIMEEGSEFIERFTHRNKYHWPMFTSCCPGWVRFLKGQFPSYTENLSTAKSPQQMFGAVAKSYFAQKIGVDPKKLFVVSIMPCTAKKAECALPTMKDEQGDPDVDVVLTTREIVRMLRGEQINPAVLPETPFDSPLGTGTGAAPVVAEIAREAGILTVGVVTKPFGFEGRRRMTQAEQGIEELRSKVDSLVIIPNERLKYATDQKITFANAFEIADDVLRQAVQSISDLIRDTGFINLDFADVTAIMKDAGLAHMGVGRAAGKGKAEEAAKMAISSPLLETSINGARGVLINVTGSMDIGLEEVEQAATLVQQAVHPDALTIFGAAFDETLDDEIRVTVIATGFDEAQQAANAAAVTQPAQTENSGAPQPLDEVKGEQGQDEMDKSFDEILRIFNKDKF